MPLISGISSSPDPLSSFFYSLDRVGEIRGVDNVLPAHGHPFEDLHDRVDAIKRHHHERLDKVKEISEEIGRPASVETFMQQLFGNIGRLPGGIEAQDIGTGRRVP